MIDLALLAWAAAAAMIGNGLQIAALLAVVIGRKSPKFAGRKQENLGNAPPLTIVRPLRGLEPDAAACHMSLFEGDYQPATVLFVVEDVEDPAVQGVQPVLERYPNRARLLVSTPTPGVLSEKVRNMITGWEAADTPIVGFCDSDIKLGREHLAACMHEFADPAASAVSVPIVYDAEGPVGRMSMLIKTVDNATFVRSAVYTGVGTVTLGGLMIFRRDDLDAVGGVAPLGDALADDLRAGERLEAAGYQLRLGDAVMVHSSGPETAWSCLARHHRWITSIRTELPLFFWLQLALLNPVAATLVAAGVLSAAGSDRAFAAWAIFAASAAVRTASAFAIDRILLWPHGVRLDAWCLARLPADIMYLLILVATLVFPFVYWRGRWFRVKLGSGRILREIGSGAGTSGAP